MPRSPAVVLRAASFLGAAVGLAGKTELERGLDELLSTRDEGPPPSVLPGTRSAARLDILRSEKSKRESWLGTSGCCSSEDMQLCMGLKERGAQSLVAARL